MLCDLNGNTAGAHARCACVGVLVLSCFVVDQNFARRGAESEHGYVCCVIFTGTLLLHTFVVFVCGPIRTQVSARACAGVDRDYLSVPLVWTQGKMIARVARIFCARSLCVGVLAASPLHE